MKRFLLMLGLPVIFVISFSSTAWAFLAVSPLSLNFGSVPVGLSAQRSVQVMNNSQTMVNISTSLSGSFNFYAINYCGRLRPHQSCIINVRFNPASVGRVSGYLYINSSTGTKGVSLFGIASPSM